MGGLAAVEPYSCGLRALKRCSAHSGDGLTEGGRTCWVGLLASERREYFRELIE